MDKRIATALAAGTVMALPLLGGCGAGAPAQSSPAAPSAAPAAPSSSASASASATPSATPSSNPAQEKGAVSKAATTFVKTALTIGYPDKSYDQYTRRLKPLMTKDGYASIASTKKENEKDLASLYDEHARSVPKLVGGVTISGLGADSATAKLSYRSVIQRQSGGAWTTLQTLKKESSTVQLLKTDGRWLVDDAT